MKNKKPVKVGINRNSKVNAREKEIVLLITSAIECSLFDFKREQSGHLLATLLCLVHNT